MDAAKPAGVPPLGLMQDWPLTTERFIEHAAKWYGTREIVSRREDGSIGRQSYRDVRSLAARLSNALRAYGIAPGDRVATLAMNGAEHVAAWYAISGIGSVCHTLNPRFSDEQNIYIINHAADRVILADGAFAPILSRLLPHCPTVEHVVFNAPPAAGVSLPVAASSLQGFTAGHSGKCRWGGFDERTAAGLCYTSGTTGHPKGVLYSHRSNYLHTLHTIQPDSLNIATRDVIMPVVPMYHANAWGLTFSGPAVGAKMVMPGHRLDGPSICNLIAEEGVTFSAGVPTVWLAVIQHMQQTGMQLPTLKRVIVGGATMPESVVRAFAEFGIEAIHAWGMTEMSPIGTVGGLPQGGESLPVDEQVRLRLKQGRSTSAVDMRIVDEEGKPLPHDGRAMGSLQVRGGSVCARYYRAEAPAVTDDGYFDTGDIATIDGDGFMLITDRAKDIIKSGGEFISSIDIENAALTHPAVALAAVIATPNEKWGERPLLIVELKEGQRASAEDMIGHLAPRLPKHWMPDAVQFVERLPLGATGKLDKKALRALRT